MRIGLSREPSSFEMTLKGSDACRYSKEYKFRPAASPIITERLKDGRTRLRGAQPTVYGIN